MLVTTTEYYVNEEYYFLLIGAKAMSRLARRRLRLTIFLGIATLGCASWLVLLKTAVYAGLMGECSNCSTAAPWDFWVILSAVGTAAAGLGTLVSGIAALLALRAAAAARDAAHRLPPRVAAPTKHRHRHRR